MGEQILPQFGRYVVTEEVGEGTIGVVYRARHQELGRDAAIKVLRPQVSRNAAAVAGMVAEASALARLDHPNIVALYDFVQEPDRTWLAEQWVDGVPLDTILAAHGRLTPEQSLGVVAGALSGLAHAHDNGLVHRDVAASNVLADMAGTSMLVDFGLAAPVPGEPGSVVPGSPSAGVVGTPAYLSPEAARSEPVGKPGDVYSAAALTYHLLSGRPVFPGTAWDMVASHRDRVAPSLEAHGPRLASLVERSLAKDPSARPPDAGAFLAELEEAAAEKYGVAWRTRASIASLVASTLGAGAASVVGAAGGGAAPTVAAGGLPGVVTGGSQALVHTGRRVGLKTLMAAGATAAVIVASVVVGINLASGDEDDRASAGDPSSEPTLSEEERRAAEREREQQERQDAIAALEASAPVGLYRYVSQATERRRDGSTSPSKNRGSWTFVDAKCGPETCRGVAESSSGAIWRYVWDGTAMSIDRPGARNGWTACVDTATGETQPIAESAARDTITFDVGAVSLTPGAVGGPPQKISLSYSGKRRIEFRGTCEPAPTDVLGFSTDLVVTRKR